MGDKDLNGDSEDQPQSLLKPNNVAFVIVPKIGACNAP